MPHFGRPKHTPPPVPAPTPAPAPKVSIFESLAQASAAPRSYSTAPVLLPAPSSSRVKSYEIKEPDWATWSKDADTLDDYLKEAERWQELDILEKELNGLLAQAATLSRLLPGLPQEDQGRAWSQLGRILGAIARLCHLLGR